ncbi:MAG: hypothetical protein LBE62_10940 [Azonexus sp.]|jgi:hypothetical protein|nr:hypothetical protein [Azonexus sp.]
MQNAKPIQNLTAYDLLKHPIWQYAMDDENSLDETYVRPINSASVPQDEWVVYQVACKVIVSSGKTYVGFLEICNNTYHCDDSSPVVVGESGTDYWWLGSEPDDKGERDKFEKFFGSTYAQLLPIQWELYVPLSGNSQLKSGVIT